MGKNPIHSCGGNSGWHPLWFPCIAMIFGSFVLTTVLTSGIILLSTPAFLSASFLLLYSTLQFMSITHLCLNLDPCNSLVSTSTHNCSIRQYSKAIFQIILDPDVLCLLGAGSFITFCQTHVAFIVLEYAAFINSAFLCFNQLSSPEHLRHHDMASNELCLSCEDAETAPFLRIIMAPLHPLQSLCTANDELTNQCIILKSSAKSFNFKCLYSSNIS